MSSRIVMGHGLKRSECLSRTVARTKRRVSENVRAPLISAVPTLHGSKISGPTRNVGCLFQDHMLRDLVAKNRLFQDLQCWLFQCQQFQDHQFQDKCSKISCTRKCYSKYSSSGYCVPLEDVLRSDVRISGVPWPNVQISAVSGSHT